MICTTVGAVRELRSANHITVVQGRDCSSKCHINARAARDYSKKSRTSAVRHVVT